MITKVEQQNFIEIAKTKLSDIESNWLQQKGTSVSAQEFEKKFPIVFSLVARFIKKEEVVWLEQELLTLETIYPGFSKGVWTKQDLARVVLMLTLNTDTNKARISSLFETAEVFELIALYKGLYLLENASEFKAHFEEGIRTNMMNVFEALSAGNPFAKKYLSEAGWNQLILKTLFVEQKLYKVEGIDAGKNENLANMLQDFVKERWAAGRSVSPEMWRMLYGFLREDVKTLIGKRNFEGKEKKAIDCVLTQNEQLNTSEFWNAIGK